MDFTLNIDKDKVRILQLTDTQLINARQSRYEGRLKPLEQERWESNLVEANCFNYIRDTIEMTKPDLILLTGDIVYGEFDDDGSSLIKLTKYMDSFQIHWAPLFGNHENESKMGVDWQCRVLEDAKYSLFRRGNVSGNSNYTIGITQKGKLKRVIYMMDSNGCANTADPRVKRHVGFARDQLEWFDSTALETENMNGGIVPSFVCYHVPTSEFGEAAVDAGYQENPYENSRYTIGKDVVSKNGDFGSKRENFPGMHPVPGLRDLFKKHGVDGVFIGHCHVVNTSVLSDGIRWTVGLKTGAYDSHNPEELGGTYIEVQEDNTFTVEHKYVKKYKLEPDRYQDLYI